MLAFIHIEKAAGLTINSILWRRFGLRHCYVEPWTREDRFFSAQDLRRLQRFHPRLESIAGHPIKPWGDLEHARSDIRYYTFLREPLSRCAAHYQYQIRRMGRKIGFEEWIQVPVFRDFQVKKLAGRDDLDAALRMIEHKPIFVGLIERFDASLVLFRSRMAEYNVDVRYTSVNTAEDNTIKNAVLSDPRSRQMLLEANRLDMELYREVETRIFPRQVLDYAGSLEEDMAGFKTSKDMARRTARAWLGVVHRNLIYKPVLHGYRKLCGRRNAS